MGTAALAPALGTAASCSMALGAPTAAPCSPGPLCFLPPQAGGCQEGQSLLVWVSQWLLFQALSLLDAVLNHELGERCRLFFPQCFYMQTKNSSFVLHLNAT